MPVPDRDSESTYNDDPPIYIHYSIEWKVTLNNRAVMRPDTEQDIVLASAAFQQHFLHPKLDDFWRRKSRSVRPEDTNVVVSVTQRKERDLTKRFSDTSIDWAVVENQLIAWGEFYHADKKIKLVGYSPVTTWKGVFPLEPVRDCAYLVQSLPL